jgi:hypothetical protein
LPFFSIFNQNYWHFSEFLQVEMEGKLQWFSGLLSKFLGKSGQNPENTES